MPRLRSRKAQAALQRGDLESAEEAFREVLAADPQAAAAYSNLGSHRHAPQRIGITH